MDLGKKYKVDRSLIQDGKWFEHDGAKFKLALAGSANEAFKFKMIKNGSELFREPETIEDYKAMRNLDREIFAATILLDWEDVEINGVPTPYSPEVAAAAFFQYPEFYDYLYSLAADVANFYHEEEAELEKN